MSEFSEGMKVGTSWNIIQRGSGDEFYARLAQVSGNVSGSPLEDYLEERDMESCRDFMEHMGGLAYPGAEELITKRPIIGSYVWKKPERSLDNGSIYLFNHGNNRRVWKGIGYHIGFVAIGIANCHLYLSPSETSDASNGELRCYRNPQSFIKSLAVGVGRLPEPGDVRVPLPLPGLSKRLVKLAKQATS